MPWLVIQIVDKQSVSHRSEQSSQSIKPDQSNHPVHNNRNFISTLELYLTYWLALLLASAPDVWTLDCFLPLFLGFVCVALVCCKSRCIRWILFWDLFIGRISRLYLTVSGVCCFMNRFVSVSLLYSKIGFRWLKLVNGTCGYFLAYVLRGIWLNC